MAKRYWWGLTTDCAYDLWAERSRKLGRFTLSSFSSWCWGIGLDDFACWIELGHLQLEFRR